LFSNYGGAIGFKVGITVPTTAVFAEGCSVIVSGGVIGVLHVYLSGERSTEEITATVYADTAIYSEDRLIIIDGSVYGSDCAVDQGRRHRLDFGGELDTDDTSLIPIPLS
jgi:hypothetical protein